MAHNERATLRKNVNAQEEVALEGTSDGREENKMHLKPPIPTEATRLAHSTLGARSRQAHSLLLVPNCRNIYYNELQIHSPSGFSTCAQSSQAPQRGVDHKVLRQTSSFCTPKHPSRDQKQESASQARVTVGIHVDESHDSGQRSLLNDRVAPHLAIW